MCLVRGLICTVREVRSRRSQLAVSVSRILRLYGFTLRLYTLVAAKGPKREKRDHTV